MAHNGQLDPSLFHFVLVHGFMSGAWCWYKVQTLLETSGFKVTSLDLKACGINTITMDSVQSFDSYTEPLINFFANYSPENCHEKVILVGHSAGGLSVTDATYKFSDKIHAAVYVAATMLKNGFATQQDIIDGMPQEFKHKDSDEKMSTRIPLEDMTLASTLTRPGPLKAIKEAKFRGNDTVDQVPRIYIRTLQDQVLKPKQQEAMIHRWPPAHVFSMDSDHNPIFSAPFLLSGLLARTVDLCFT